MIGGSVNVVRRTLMVTPHLDVDSAVREQWPPEHQHDHHVYHFPTLFAAGGPLCTVKIASIRCDLLALSCHS